MNTLCQPSDLMPRRIRQELCPAAAGPKFRPWLPLALASLKGRCRARILLKNTLNFMRLQTL